ncbi:MAG TPA: glycosyltransferase N-terminal domain-containing protein, partial [Chthoniobacterales bacterium]|nr:glycosyltransferase N-terminal domain-containing protein [Chthoniobacterales bacterium]
MIRLIYNLLLPLGLLLFLPAYIAKMRRRGGYWRNFGQRFGFYSRELKRWLALRRVTWIHAVSVGEVGIALTLARKLRELDPQFTCVITTTTTTGYAVAEREAADWLQVMYNPLDLYPVVRRAFASIRPLRIVLVEAEVWPNLAAIARARRIPLSLVNARLSPRSERRFRRFRFFVAPTFRCLDLVCVQEPEDVDRWASIGVRREALRHVGSIKYDPSAAETASASAFEFLHSLGVDRNRPVILGGSTHPGEEEILARVFLRLRQDLPELFLIVAPRHVERTPEVRAQLVELGLTTALRRGENLPRGSVDCLLLNTTGELRNWYAVATIVFMGKSLTTSGGQNPVEPILSGKPVLFGPHMENFAALARALLQHEGAIQIADPDALTAAASTLLRDAAARERLAQNAHAVLAAHRGATQRTAELVLAGKSLAP